MGAFIRVRFCALAFSIGALVVTLSAASIFRSMQEAEPIVAGAGVTAQRMLSATEPSLAGGPGDTPVFELAGEKPGGTMLLLGGTHPQEIGGMMAAILMVENARVKRGRLIVVPQANRSRFHPHRSDGSLSASLRDRDAGGSALVSCRHAADQSGASMARSRTCSCTSRSSSGWSATRRATSIAIIRA